MPELKRIKYRHKWEGPIEGWTRNYIRRQLWRFIDRYEYDDLLHEAYIKFDRCKRRYQHIGDAPHFMKLYQTALRNHFNDLASERSMYVDMATLVHDDHEYNYDKAIEQIRDESIYDTELIVTLRCAPAHVALFFREFLDGVRTGELRKLQRAKRVLGGLAKRRTNNEAYCKWLGLDPADIDLVKDVETYLTSDDDWCIKYWVQLLTGDGDLDD